MLLDLCVNHELPITNTKFEHREVHKCTWYQNTIGQGSMIDFVVLSSDLRPYVMDQYVN